MRRPPQRAMELLGERGARQGLMSLDDTSHQQGEKSRDQSPRRLSAIWSLTALGFVLSMLADVGGTFVGCAKQVGSKWLSK